MGDIGVLEFVLVLVVMLLVLGPEQAAQTVREGGRWLRRLRQLANNMRIVLADELEQMETLKRSTGGTLPGTGGAKHFSEIAGKKAAKLAAADSKDSPDEKAADTDEDDAMQRTGSAGRDDQGRG